MYTKTLILISTCGTKVLLTFCDEQDIRPTAAAVTCINMPSIAVATFCDVNKATTKNLEVSKKIHERFHEKFHERFCENIIKSKKKTHH